MTFRDTIDSQRKALPPATAWWPPFLFHFTELHNALNILDCGWIYGREEAKRKKLMQSDNASSSVIDITSDFVKNYARLYFRPRTATQYHNEGYKPTHIRKQEVNASCPVPIFFLLDAQKVLSLKGTQFVECGLAGQRHNPILSGPEAFSALNFEKIYHDGPHELGSDITQYRHSEVVREGGIPLAGLLTRIVCRSQAEKQTLLSMIKKQLPNQFQELSAITYCISPLHLFCNNGVFVRKISLLNDFLTIYFNDCSGRFGLDEAKPNGTDFEIKLHLRWTASKGGAELSEARAYHKWLSYASCQRVKVQLPDITAERLHIRVTFDDCLMYENELELCESTLV